VFQKRTFLIQADGMRKFDQCGWYGIRDSAATMNVTFDLWKNAFGL
jgi:hypothetical protein